MNIVAKLKSTKSNIDQLPIYLFKKLVNILAYPLSKIINCSFLTGVFPESLKIARITPILKQGDPTNPSNYRPISSLHYISKSMKKVFLIDWLHFVVNFL